MEITREFIEQGYLDAVYNNFNIIKFICNVYKRPLNFLSGLSSIDIRLCNEIPQKYLKYYTKKDLYWKINDGFIDYPETYTNLINNYKDIIVFHPSYNTNVLFTDNWCFDIDDCEFYFKSSFPTEILDYVKFVKNEASIEYITGITQAGIQIMKRSIKQVENSEILCNYNDDLPNDKIIDFLKSKDSGLVVLRSIPGAGKTYLLRSYINLLRDIRFMTMDVNDFSLIVQNKQNLDMFKDKVLILEDCEELLKDRNRSSFNTSISNLLNLTDGLFGDFLNFKVVCTLNTDLNNLDKALLRKGRIKILYELKELTKDKANALRNKLGKSGGKSNILCDIYNEDSVGVIDQKITNRIGF